MPHPSRKPSCCEAMGWRRISCTGERAAAAAARRATGARIAIHEVLPITGELRELVGSEASREELNAAAARAGMRGLIEDGMDKVCKGMTTLAGSIARGVHALNEIAALNETTGQRGGTGMEGSLQRMVSLLQEAHHRGASDLHLSAGAPAMLRVAGRLAGIWGYAPERGGDRRYELVAAGCPARRRDSRQRARLTWPMSSRAACASG